MRQCVSASLVLWAGLSCASAGDPPGGAPDRIPPAVVGTEPESGAVLTAVPKEATIQFDEVISENVASQPTNISGAVLLSPTTGETRVAWHRDHISVRPRNGFQPGRIYRLEVLPVINDLRNNRLRSGRIIIFSTGPEIPHAELSGAVVDWLGGRPAARGLIEAMLMPDSLDYRALADSGGMFRIGDLPPGTYLVRGGVDTNNDRRLAGREALDSVTVTIDSTRSVELFAFPHDTTAPNIKTVEATDSITLKVTFTQPLSDSAVLDTAAVTVALQEDSTTRLPLAGVFTQKMLDSLAKHTGDSIAAAHAAADSARRAADTTAARQPAPVRPPAANPARPAAPPTRPGLRPASALPIDSTLAQKMLARRPAPSDVRLIRMAQPLVPETRYVIYLDGVTNLLGVSAPRRGSIRPQKPRPPRPTAADSARARSDSTRAVPADSLAAPRDTLPTPTRPAQPAAPVPTRP